MAANDAPHKDAAGPRACYGLSFTSAQSVKCPRRESCALFEARGVVDGMHIETCQQGNTWPLYQPNGAC